MRRALAILALVFTVTACHQPTYCQLHPEPDANDIPCGFKDGIPV